MRRTTDEIHTRIQDGNSLQNLDFADDVALLSSPNQHMQNKSKKLEDESEKVGLKINIDKTKIMGINLTNNDPIILRAQEIEGVDKFVYLGATITPEGGMGDLQNRISKLETHSRNWKNNNM